MPKKIITVIAKDKPGLIATVSDILFKNQCNIENISQTILQSEFAGIFLVSAPSGLEKTSLKDHLINALDDTDIAVNIKDIKEDEQKGGPVKSDPFIITTMGPDKKGLVASFSKIIMEYRANITDLKAVFEGGENPNRNFMIYEVDIPKDTNHSDLIKKLRANASDLGLNISIQHRNIFRSINKI